MSWRGDRFILCGALPGERHSPSQAFSTVLESGDLRSPRHSSRRDHVINVVGLLQTVFDDQLHVVTLIEDLAAHVRMNGLEQFHLLVLLRDQFLVHRGDLDVQVVVGQIEVGSEVFGRFTVFVELNRKTLRFVVPRNPIEIEKKGELALTVVSEFNFVRLGAVGDQVTPASTAPVNSASSGNN